MACMFDTKVSKETTGHRRNERALICTLLTTDFEDAVRNAISIGGDSDTIGAIAGAGH